METVNSRSPSEAAVKTNADSDSKVPDLEASASSSSSRGGKKNGGSKDNVHSFLNSVHKSTSQIKKPPHRRSISPLNWFPRQKADSFLKRKIKHLQEIEGMNISLEETLGNANPHYTRIAREKIAAQEAAKKAMEARKAAMIEASWRRILGAAGIKCKEAEARLEKAEKYAGEAFEAARALGVMMYDKPDNSRQTCQIQTSAIGGRSTHRVTASFQTAFEVDKEVAAAVKRAFTQLANFPSSSNTEEFRELLQKISQNPDDHGVTKPEVSYECSTDPVAELKPDSSASSDTKRKHAARIKNRKYKNSMLPVSVVSNSSISPTELSDLMLDRLKGLHEDELASLAVIVATCGLNAALREMQRCKRSNLDPDTCVKDNEKKDAPAEVPSLDKFLVKHVSRLEREVQEAKISNAASNNQINSAEFEISDKSEPQVEPTIGLDSILVKHVSRLEREIVGAKKKYRSTALGEDGESVDLNTVSNKQTHSEKTDVSLPDNVLTLEGDQSNSEKELIGGSCKIADSKECEQLNSSQKPTQGIECSDLLVLPEKIQRSSISREQGKENRDSNIGMPSSAIPLDEINQSNKHMSRVGKDKIKSLKTYSADERIRGDDTHDILGLDKILVDKEKDVQALEEKRTWAELRDNKKEENDASVSDNSEKEHVSGFEKEKLKVTENEGTRTVKRSNQQFKECAEGLDEILVKHQSELEKAKLAASRPSSDYVKHEARREARERELQEAWGGLSLGNSLKPHVSRIEREKAAWRKAEEEERMRESGL